MKLSKFKCLVLSILLLKSSLLWAAQSFYFQGKLKDYVGTPIDGDYDLQFSIYDALTAGNLVYCSIYSTTVEEGLVNLEINSSGNSCTSGSNTLNIDFSDTSKTYYLQITIDEGTSSNNVIDTAAVLSPRLKLLPSLVSLDSQKLDNQTPSSYSLFTELINSTPAAAGAKSIGVDLTNMTNSSPGANDLQTVLEAIDVGLAGGGGGFGGILGSTTTVTHAANDVIFNMNSTGDFRIQDNGSNVFVVSDNGTTTISNVTISAGSVNNVTIGATTRAAASFTTINSNDHVTIEAEKELRLVDGVGGQYIALKSPNNIASNYTLTLPVDDGTNGQLLQTNGSGVLAWTSTGTLSTQAANSVDIDGGAIDSTAIGGTTPAAGAFTTLSATGNFTLGANSIVLGDGAQTITISAPADVTPANYVLELPADDGDANEMLQTDGSGNLVWNFPSLIRDSDNASSVVVDTSDRTIFSNNGAETARMTATGEFAIGSATLPTNTKMYIYVDGGVTWTSSPDQIGLQVSTGNDAINLADDTYIPGHAPAADTTRRARVAGLFSSTVDLNTNTPNVGIMGLARSRGGNAYANAIGGVFAATSLNASGTNYGIYIPAVSGGATNYSIYSGNTSRSYFGGDIGIGTTAPARQLHLLTAANNQLIRQEGYRGDAFGNWLESYRARGNSTTPASLADGDYIWGALGSGHDGTDWETGVVSMIFKVDGTPGDSADDMPTRIEFATTPDGSSTATERMRISSTGFVGIGRTATTNRLEVNGTASKTTAGDWLANSDRRIKKNIKSIQNPIEKIMALRPVTFGYTDEYKSKNDFVGERQNYYNFIAQEYQKVFPEDVYRSGEFLDSGEEILQIDTHSASITAIAAIQEQQQTIEKNHMMYQTMNGHVQQLKKKIENLESEVDELKHKNKTLITYLCSKDRNAPLCK